MKLLSVLLLTTITLAEAFQDPRIICTFSVDQFKVKEPKKRVTVKRNPSDRSQVKKQQEKTEEKYKNENIEEDDGVGTSIKDTRVLDEEDSGFAVDPPSNDEVNEDKINKDETSIKKETTDEELKGKLCDLDGTQSTNKRLDNSKQTIVKDISIHQVEVFCDINAATYSITTTTILNCDQKATSFNMQIHTKDRKWVANAIDFSTFNDVNTHFEFPKYDQPLEFSGYPIFSVDNKECIFFISGIGRLMVIFVIVLTMV